MGDARARANIFLDDGLNNFASATAQIFPNGAGGVSFQDGSGEQATGLSYKTDTWRRWDLSYTIGTNSFSLSIDGVAAPNALTPWGTGPVSRLVLSNGSIASDGFFFVDANPQLQASTPEPTAWLLVAGGLAAVLAARNGVKRASIAEKVPCRRSGQSRPLLRPPSWTPGLASSPNRSRYVGLTPVPWDWSPRTDGLALYESRVIHSEVSIAVSSLKGRPSGSTFRKAGFTDPIPSAAPVIVGKPWGGHPLGMSTTRRHVLGSRFSVNSRQA